MIAVAAFAAALSRVPPDLVPQGKIIETGVLAGGRTSAPAAEYADRALALLTGISAETGLVCLCGPSGPMVKAFDEAWRRSPNGELTGPGFSDRSRRIHPFTLLRSLQNGVCASLSMRRGLQGPCLNALEGATSLVWLLPQIEQMLARCPALLLVLVSAGEQLEEGVRRRACVPEALGLEGAVCLLLTRGLGLGYLEAAVPDSRSRPDLEARAAPALAGGLALLRCMAEARDRALITLIDSDGVRAGLRWRRT